MKADIFNQKLKLIKYQLQVLITTPGLPASITGTLKEVIAVMEELKSVPRGVHWQSGKLIATG